jgi:hypothetical protein
VSSGGTLEQIRATHISDENEISGESADSIVAPLAVRHEEGEVLGGVTGSVQRAESNVAELYL